MTMEKSFNVAVVGATGAVGQQILKVLEDRNFPVRQLKPLASARSAGKTVQFQGKKYVVEEATPDAFKGVDIALFSAGGSVSKKLVPEAVKRGAVCVDNTNAFRMEPDVPLVVPEVNADKIFEHEGLIANPNCSTIQMVAALKPIKDRYGINRIIVSTYQAVSGAGYEAMEECLRQTRAVLDNEPVNPDILPVGSLPRKHQIAFNAVPQIDVFEENDFTREEMKMVNETKKIFDDQNIKVSATCVRLPVITGHSEAVYVETDEDFDVNDVRNLLREAPGIVVQDNPAEQEYPLATDAAGKLDVFVGRIRRDVENPRGLHLWVVSDNLLKGAAWNTVQIAEHLITKM
ncbi:MAG: aspartate-semialdehyde dehydrogenase [Bacillaceae bacterium]|nr:aspartate-semialdehyde dehydrogenase [Bacillaceae bacterium]